MTNLYLPNSSTICSALLRRKYASRFINNQEIAEDEVLITQRKSQLSLPTYYIYLSSTNDSNIYLKIKARICSSGKQKIEMFILKCSNLLLLILAACQLFRSTSCSQFYPNVNSANLRRREMPFGNPNPNYGNRDAHDGYGPSTGGGTKGSNVPGQGATTYPGTIGFSKENAVNSPGGVSNGGTLPGGILPGSANGIPGSPQPVANSGTIPPGIVKSGPGNLGTSPVTPILGSTPQGASFNASGAGLPINQENLSKTIVGNGTSTGSGGGKVGPANPSNDSNAAAPNGGSGLVTSSKSQNGGGMPIGGIQPGASALAGSTGLGPAASPQEATPGSSAGTPGSLTGGRLPGINTNSLTGSIPNVGGGLSGAQELPVNAQGALGGINGHPGVGSVLSTQDSDGTLRGLQNIPGAGGQGNLNGIFAGGQAPFVDPSGINPGGPKGPSPGPSSGVLTGQGTPNNLNGPKGPIPTPGGSTGLLNNLPVLGGQGASGSPNGISGSLSSLLGGQAAGPILGGSGREQGSNGLLGSVSGLTGGLAGGISPPRGSLGNIPVVSSLLGGSSGPGRNAAGAGLLTGDQGLGINLNGLGGSVSGLTGGLRSLPIVGGQGQNNNLPLGGGGLPLNPGRIGSQLGGSVSGLTGGLSSLPIVGGQGQNINLPLGGGGPPGGIGSQLGGSVSGLTGGLSSLPIVGGQGQNINLPLGGGGSPGGIGSQYNGHNVHRPAGDGYGPALRKRSDTGLPVTDIPSFGDGDDSTDSSFESFGFSPPQDFGSNSGAFNSQGGSDDSVNFPNLGDQGSNGIGGLIASLPVAGSILGGNGETAPDGQSGLLNNLPVVNSIFRGNQGGIIRRGVSDGLGNLPVVGAALGDGGVGGIVNGLPVVGPLANGNGPAGQASSGGLLNGGSVLGGNGEPNSDGVGGLVNGLPVIGGPGDIVNGIGLNRLLGRSALHDPRSYQGDNDAYSDTGDQEAAQDDEYNLPNPFTAREGQRGRYDNRYGSDRSGPSMRHYLANSYKHGGSKPTSDQEPDNSDNTYAKRGVSGFLGNQNDQPTDQSSSPANPQLDTQTSSQSASETNDEATSQSGGVLAWLGNIL
ncbi:hypothetical protein PTTG_07540 [Puccinia triticina 1-1 BBBD Race 1]|uniref:Uncharacterized protein n=1 Tax=Puccinia triticina (isolate 1-1 / race 1 (BBBD)) TaxID=630390 RepID=A0A180GDX6_PUCT1|nr:hypothetical protein PTTG_07540 [Puccinia triticina 1-1 BBBD Race 1]